MGSSRRDFSDFPYEMKSEMGYALFQAQVGGRHRKAKTFKGTGDAGIIEIVDDYRGDTFRTVYTVRFGSVLYVLHAFQKKSKKGIETPKGDMHLIEQRLRDAERLHKEAEL
ncbi:MAG: type toxin-antitoxin system RelE/ParE family toxin [Rhizobium sp.]|nr:type toxin-antitoxin system RelE/ParE family toxin [Rhizobium sp.]